MEIYWVTKHLVTPANFKCEYGMYPKNMTAIIAKLNFVLNERVAERYAANTNDKKELEMLQTVWNEYTRGEIPEVPQPLF